LGFDDITMLTQPQYDFFVKLAKWEANIEMISGLWDQVPSWLRPWCMAVG